MIEAVTFDFWNTLVSGELGDLRALRLAAWTSALDDAGLDLVRDRLEEDFDHFTAGFHGAIADDAFFQAERVAEEILAELEERLPRSAWASLLEAFQTAAQDVDVVVAPDARDAVLAVRERGARVGIVSNTLVTPGHVLRRWLERHGLLELFHHWSFSDEVGAAKPDGAIFRHALDGLGARPDRTIHVGDSRRLDVRGALGAGITPIRYTGFLDDTTPEEPEAPVVVSTLSEVPVLLSR
jgi:putative hydrolase of the HAD superfamily